MMKSCYSCGIPLDSPMSGASNGNYCGNCSDQQGNLKPYEEIKKGVALWLASWAPESAELSFDSRAESYLRAMPAWVDKK